MRNYVFRQKVKSLLSFLCILILLPYIITVFVNGSKIADQNGQQATYVYYVNGEQSHQVLWEEYFIGVLAKEIAADAELEAVKAQAVILRTTIYKEMEGNQVDISYFSLEELKNKWGIHFAEYYEKYQKAVTETENEVLRFNGDYALLPFHQSSCGMTRNASEVWESQEYPYLAAKECPLDKEADLEMHSYRISYQEIQEKLQADFVAVDEEMAAQPLTFEDFEIVKVDSAGYVTEICVRGTTFSGEAFRQILGLASSAFSLQNDSEEKLAITTAGNGHGVGLSQWSAGEMAKSGKSYIEILQFFYEGTSLEDGGEIFSNFE